MYRCFSTSNIEFCDEKVSKLSKNKQKISIFLRFFTISRFFAHLMTGHMVQTQKLLMRLSILTIINIF